MKGDPYTEFREYQRISGRSLIDQDRTQNMKITDFREFRKNTLLGFFTLHVHGLRIKDCTLHEKSGKRWFGFPGRVMIDQSGGIMKDEKGKTQYAQIIDVAEEYRDELQRRVSEASYDVMPVA